jgi:integrase
MLPSNRRAGDSILTITRDEFAGKLLPAVPVEHWAIVCMAAGCGLRWGECAGLSWDSIDLDAAEVHVGQRVVELSGRLDLRPYPKTRAGRRTVPMPGFVVAALRTHLREQPAIGLAFGTRSGTPVRRSNFRRQVCGHRRWSGPGSLPACVSTICGTATRLGWSQTAGRSTWSAGSWAMSRSARP